MNIHQKRRDGFTIIEVLIVLAIAALILLIVFLAVPALQRNSRNNQYRSEASRILAGANEYASNNNGAMPTTSVSTTAGSPAAQILANSNAKNITTLTVTTPAAAVTRTPTFSSAFLETAAICPAAVTGNSMTLAAAQITPNAPTNSMILIYAVEKADGTVNAVCQRS